MSLLFAYFLMFNRSINRNKYHGNATGNKAAYYRN